MDQNVDQNMAEACDAVLGLIAADLAARSSNPALLVVGIAGAQGSGKSTLARAVAGRLALQGIASATLSIDDLYLTRAERLALAAREHPLLATRGVPGTHDVALGLHLIAALERGEPVRLPRFDKARDDRAAPTGWPAAPVRTRVLLLEGWCVGALPEPEATLNKPVNALERDEDADGRWRRRANAALAGDYARLFARIDRLVLLAAPDFDVVAQWRTEQEQGLRKELGTDAGPLPGVMTAPQIARFVMFYERITRAMLRDVPARADLVISLDSARGISAITGRP